MEKSSGDILHMVNKTADSSLIIPDRPRALIIDGNSLITAMADPNIRSALLQFSTRCKAVVANRVSPDQKRSLVQLIKTGEATRSKISSCSPLHDQYAR
jgi:magnesium-transporting ATPase (P-type)